MTVIQEKTGVLIAAAGFLGAEHSGAPAEVRDALHAFGRNMGQVFQIVDDIIDIWSPGGVRQSSWNRLARGCVHPARALRHAARR